MQSTVRATRRLKSDPMILRTARITHASSPPIQARSVTKRPSMRTQRFEEWHQLSQSTSADKKARCAPGLATNGLVRSSAANAVAVGAQVVLDAGKAYRDLSADSPLSNIIAPSAFVCKLFIQGNHFGTPRPHLRAKRDPGASAQPPTTASVFTDGRTST